MVTLFMGIVFIYLYIWYNILKTNYFDKTVFEIKEYVNKLIN